MSKAKAKGTRAENLVRDLHLEAGVPAERVPLSGALGGKYTGDVIVGSIEHPIFRIEVKSRKTGTGFATIEKWLGKHDILFLKKDRTTPFVCMPFETYIKIMKGYIENETKSM